MSVYEAMGRVQYCQERDIEYPGFCSYNLDNDNIQLGETQPINADTLGGYSVEYFFNNFSGIPGHSAEDEGKILCIINGMPAWTSIPNVREVAF